MKNYPQLILMNLIGFMLSLQIYAQNQITAIAYPMESIVVDGDLSDWSADIPKYIIGQNHGDKLINAEDFSANFMIAYNEKEGCIYVGLEVIDDEYVSGDDKEEQDEVLVYFDREHNFLGGAPFYYVCSNNQLKLSKQSVKIDPHNTDITDENAMVKIKRGGNRTNYEWKVVLGDKVKKNAILGLDYFLVDQDNEPKSESYLLWKDGFGKSQNTNKIGHVMLLDKEQPLGKVQGFIVSDSLVKASNINELKIVSTENSDFWITTTVDTSGFYAATLPIGSYEIVPTKRFTSTLYSGGFNQNTRKIIYENKVFVEVKEQMMSQADSLVISIKEQPKMPLNTKNKQRIEYLDKKEIDAFVSEWQDYWEIPAVSIALIRDNAVFYENASGIKNAITKQAVNKNTIFEAASISKSMFSVMVLRLAERNIIDLDKPLFEYLPFPNIANDERSKLLTARHVLNHQSGLPNWAWDGPGTWKEGGELKLNFEPGTSQFGYSGEAFNYLGRVVEKITDQKLEDLFKEEIAIPFGLKNTYCKYNDAQENIMATGHYHQYIHCKSREYLASPASSVTTCASDLSNYVLGLMNEKNMSQTSYNLIYTPYTHLTPEQRLFDPEIKQYIAHGFFVQETPEGMILQHGGNNGDFDCKFSYNKDKKLGYIVFTNSNLGDEFVRALEVFLFSRDIEKKK